MGRRKKLQSDSAFLTTVKAKTFTEYFESAFPDYLVMGMSYEEYWSGNPRLTLMYWRANRLRTIRTNQEMYLQGMYTFHAVSRALANIHFDDKHHKQIGYLEQPFDIVQKTQEEHLIDVENAKAKVKAQLNAWKMEYSSK